MEEQKIIKHKKRNLFYFLSSILVPIVSTVLLITFLVTAGKDDIVLLSEFENLADHLMQLFEEPIFILGVLFGANALFTIPACMVNAIFGIVLIEQFDEMQCRKRCIAMFVYNILAGVTVLGIAIGMIVFSITSGQTYALIQGLIMAVILIAYITYCILIYALKIHEFKIMKKELEEAEKEETKEEPKEETKEENKEENKEEPKEEPEGAEEVKTEE